MNFIEIDDSEKALAAAVAAISKAATTLAKLQAMVDKATTSKEFAKCSAAKLQLSYAIYEEAHTRAMPKAWKK